ncbi:MAG TPA: hypothetical protein VNO70_04500, partial [Blastocatellia bacterium]|nr:hypothetical protein [Blastocatellia bacterium]
MSGNRKSIPKIAGLIPLSGRRAGQRLLILFAGGLLCCAGLVFAVKSYHRREPVSALPAVSPTRQRGPQLPGALRARLSLQPEADRFRRRLGRRFLDPGREVSVLTGTLTIGAASHTMRIIRTQQEDDELVTIAFDGGPPALTWSAAQGARSASGPASGVLRELAERLALDSPDQFVLAQLRGA